MSFWEWFALLVTSPFWVIGVVILFELVGIAMMAGLVAVLAIIEACRK